MEPIAADRKIGVPEGRVQEWEQGRSRPTIAQLREAARVYRRPLGVFFLPEPPAGFETMRDFRRLFGSGEAEWSAALSRHPNAASRGSAADWAAPPTTRPAR